jgi:hypothetical protein
MVWALFPILHSPCDIEALPRQSKHLFTLVNNYTAVAEPHKGVKIFCGCSRVQVREAVLGRQCVAGLMDRSSDTINKGMVRTMAIA